MPMMKKKLAWLALAAAALILAAALIYPKIARDVRENSREAIRETVLRRASECYAVEGAYPESLSYLEEHYALVINHRDFIVTYEVYASNQMPEVRVLVRGEG